MRAKWKIKSIPLLVNGDRIRWIWTAVAPSSREVFASKFASQPEALDYVNEQIEAGVLAEATA